MTSGHVSLTEKTKSAAHFPLSRLGLGAASLGNMYAKVEVDDAVAAIKAAVDCGTTYFDTAPLYGHGMSETKLGAGLSHIPREAFAISTKVGRLLVPDEDLPENYGGYLSIPKLRPVYDYSFDGAYRSLEASLKRLGLDRVDIVYIHDIDVRTHGEDQPSRFREAMAGSYRALERMRSEGVISRIGIGVNETKVCLDALSAGDFDLFLLASRYTLLEQEPLDALFPLAQEKGVGIVIGGPFSTGILASGAIPDARYNYRPAPDDIMEKVRRIETVCNAFAVPLPAAALQFSAMHPCVASVIPGSRSATEVRQNAALMNVPIQGEFWDRLKQEGLLRGDAPTSAR